MKRFQKSVAVLMIFAMLLSLSSCTSNRRKGAEKISSPDASKRELTETEPTDPIVTTDVPVPTDTPAPTTAPNNKEYSESEIVTFTMFSGMAGKDLDTDNEIKEIIAKKTGVRVTEYWLSAQTESEAVSAIMATGKLPDFINTGEVQKLYEGGYLVAWDEYLKKYPNLKDLQHHKKVFKPTIIETHRNINFDLKRKPLEESLVPAYAEYDGTEYEVAQLQTEPYTDVDEFNMYRMIGESFPCLRTMNEWNAFFKKVEKHKKGLLEYDDFEILKQIIHMHKTRKRIIPALITPGMSVAEKIDWINNHNHSGQIYTANHWKHASDPIPEKKQIPIEVLEQKIKEWFTT